MERPEVEEEGTAARLARGRGEGGGGPPHRRQRRRRGLWPASPEAEEERGGERMGAGRGRVNTEAMSRLFARHSPQKKLLCELGP
jgi:hypothetical protein